MIMTALIASQLVLSSPAIAVGVYGHVEQHRDAGRTPVSRFDQIEEGATIITHADSSAQIRLASGSLLRIGANSELALSQLEHGTPAGKRKESLRLVAGRIWAQVTSLFGDSKFEVETGTAVAGVRGTSFMVEVQDGKGRFVLLHGALDLLREGANLRLDQPGAFVDTTADGFGKPGTLGGSALRDLQRQIGGASGAMVAQLVAQQRSGGGAGGQRGRAASRGDITGPGKLVDAPIAASPAVSAAPTDVPTTTTVNIVIQLPSTGTGAEQ